MPKTDYHALVASVHDVARAFALKTLRKFPNLKREQIDDILAGLYLDLYKAAQTFDASKGNFYTYAITAVRVSVSCRAYEELYGVARGATTKAFSMAKAKVQFCSLDVPTFSDEAVDTVVDTLSAPDDLAPVLDKLVCEDLRRDLKTHLTDLQFQMVWLRYGEDLTQAEIQKRLGCSRKHVDNAIQRALPKLRPLFAGRA